MILWALVACLAVGQAMGPRNERYYEKKRTHSNDAPSSPDVDYAESPASQSHATKSAQPQQEETLVPAPDPLPLLPRQNLGGPSTTPLKNFRQSEGGGRVNVKPPRSKDDLKILIKATKKSGTTWLECLVENALIAYCQTQDGCVKSGQSRYVEGPRREQGLLIALKHQKIRFGPVTTKHTHDMDVMVPVELKRAKKLIIVNILRDPRDALVSKYRWVHPNQTEDEQLPFSWVRAKAPITVEDIAYFWWSCRNLHLNWTDARCVVVTYSKLKQDVSKELLPLGEILGLDRRAFAESCDTAEVYCSLEEMRKQEMEGTLPYRRTDDPKLANKQKVQRGKNGDFLKRLNPDEISHINSLALKRFKQVEPHVDRAYLLNWFTSLPNSTLSRSHTHLFNRSSSDVHHSSSFSPSRKTRVNYQPPSPHRNLASIPEEWFLAPRKS
eukprot:gb/GEZN01007640.1/.p1 GENE.gb/GEZN01007640.1/~~gb/GEZN01007640.1/.p1  ORF type:complete len:440 (+),score=35.36 gb/GEZN01007640.1/:44-1363(+)